METTSLNKGQSWDIRKENFQLIPVHEIADLLDDCAELVAQSWYRHESCVSSCQRKTKTLIFYTRIFF